MKEKHFSRSKKILSTIMIFLLTGVMTFAAACTPNTADNNNDQKPGGGGEIVNPDPEPVPPYQEGTVTPTGGGSGVLSANGKFYTDYPTLADERVEAKKLGIEIGEEGFVLLKNENNALPLSRTERYATLFGMHSTNLKTSGGGSGSGSLSADAETLPGSLKDDGFVINPKTINLYETYNALGTVNNELPISFYGSSVTSTYRSYNDVAIITISRSGAENNDVEMHDVADHSDPEDHALELDDNEEALIKHVKQYFDKVVVLINASNIMELGELAAPKTQSNLGVDAILWVGNTGNDAIAAVGHILKGDVSPSGKTVDLWSADFKKDPTWTNFGAQEQNDDENGKPMDAYLYTEDGEMTNYKTVEYREDIYAGYRYYETMAYEMNAASTGSGDTWYDNAVVYPFGYGLSYTTFDWELTEDMPQQADIAAANSTITVKVRVTNTGTVAGKDVVQVYYSAPYTPGGIEKAYNNLVGFAKTDLLEPGESQVVSVQFVAQDMASFDWNDANGNDFKGYELEAGDYKITVNRDSHTPVLSMTRTLNSPILCKTDIVTGSEIEPIFVDEYTTVTDGLLENKLSRFTMVDQMQPVPESVADRTIDDETKAMLDDQDTYDVWEDNEDDPYYVKADGLPSNWNQAAETPSTKSPLQLSDMSGIPYEQFDIVDGKIVEATDANTQKWVTFMNQFTWEELHVLLDIYGQSQTIDHVGKPTYTYADGPVQIRGGYLFPCAPILSATYNIELAEEMGRMVGNESIFNGEVIWFGPAMNTHRSPFTGRNFEYYSEDGVQGGLIAASVIKGVTSKGVIAYAKHFFLNDQEEYRADAGGVLTFATEQTMREIYLKPFEYIVKAGCLGMMTSFNRIGYIVNSNNWAVHETLLRDEWGFTGVTGTDSWTRDYCPVNLMLRAGDDALVGEWYQYPKNALTVGEWDAQAKCVRVPANEVEKASNTNSMLSPTHYAAVRKSAQRMLYALVNSHAIKNGLSSLSVDVVLEYNVNNNVELNLAASTDFSVELGENASLPAGLTLDGKTITGKPTHFGVTSVPINVSCDGWIQTTGTLNINVVSALHVDGAAYDPSKPIEVAAGQKYTYNIDSPAFAYHNTLSTGGGFGGSPCVVNWWHSADFQNAEGSSQKGRFNAPEEYSAADILVRDPSLFDDIYSPCTVDGCNVTPIAVDLGNGTTHNFYSGEYNFYLIPETGDIANKNMYDENANMTDTVGAFSLKSIANTVTGITGQTYTAYTSAELTFDTTGLSAGTYTVKVMVVAPYTSRQNNWFLTNRGSVGIYAYIQEITFKVV